jgi:uncharacterized protein YecE (DUF72 family)
MLHVGALLERPPGHKYSAALRFAELAPRAPLPRAATLAKARAGLPADFIFGLRAPRTSVASSRGALRFDDALEAGLDWLLAAANALTAQVVVFNTPADLTPGARSRDLLREFASRLPRLEQRHYVWLPQGVWEPADAQAVCADLGLCYGFDPLEGRPGPGEVTYATLRAFGHRASFSTAALSDATATTLSFEPKTAFMSVDAERAFDIARRIRRLTEETATDAALEEDADAAANDAFDDEASDDERDDESDDDVENLDEA